MLQAQANDVKAQNDLVRYKQLVDKQEISQQLYDQAVAAAASGNASCGRRESLRSRRRPADHASARRVSRRPRRTSVLRKPVPSRSRRRKPALFPQRPTCKEKQAALEQAELNLQYTKIIAPVDGVVSKSVEVGMNVQPGQQLLTIVPLNDVWVTANFKETQLKYMRPGQTRRI